MRRVYATLLASAGVITGKTAVSILDSTIVWEDIAVAVGLLMGSIILGMIVRRIVIRAAQHGSADEQVVRLFGRLASFAIVTAGFVYALIALGIRVGPLVGALGVGGVAIAFALKEVLENFVAGMLLQLRRPFVVGDQITIGDEGGTVEDITFRTVQIRQFSGERAYIPSRNVITNTIVNQTAFPDRRSAITVGVAYGTDLDHVTELLVDAVSSVDIVNPAPPPEVFVDELADSSINLVVRFWHASRQVEGWRTRHEVYKAVVAALDAAGIDIPFPQRVLTTIGDAE